MRAASSLPLPDSPVIKTGAWLRDSRSIIERTVMIADDSPSNWYEDAAAGFSGTFSACLTSARSCSSATGFAR